MSRYFVHNSSIIENDVKIGEDTKVWHFSHILPGSTIGERCSFGQNCVVGPNVKLGDGIKVQNNVSIYEGVEILKSRGIFSIVTFHSLEDKVVKKIFRELEDTDIGKRVNKKVIKPSREEVEENRRSRSAKLRVFRKK